MRWWQISVVFWVMALAAKAGEVPETLFLSWEGDPTTTMTAQWLRGPGLGDHPKPDRPEQARWRKAEGGTWAFCKAKATPFPDPKLWRLKQISWNRIQNKKAIFPHPTKAKESAWMTLKVSWSDLEPGTDYVFTIGDSPEMKFRTAPAKLDGTLVFAEGGDVDVTETAEKMIALGCSQDPLFF
ncbi:MAG: hypothetical protein EBZ07_07925, partial [Verrucomicrobia bacterium]|nr:hypothetical protein [Verrucomicrobiota bacterium]